MIFRWYARFVTRHHRAILLPALPVLVLSAWAFVALNGRVSFEAFVAPGSEAQRGADFLESQFRIGDPNLIVMVTARRGTVDSPAVSAQARRLAHRIAAQTDVANVESYWGAPHLRALRSSSGHRGLILVRIRGDGKHVDERLTAIRGAVLRSSAVIGVRAGGPSEFVNEIAGVTKHELARAELITAPLTLIALLIVFGSLLAALLPLGIAIYALLGTGAVLYGMSYVTPISSAALFFTSILSLGLAVDYSLFLVSRFREEFQARGTVEDAVVSTVETAGRTVVFSAASVAAAGGGLLLLPLQFLRSLGLAGIATAGITGVTAVVLVPALLMVLGPRLSRARNMGGRLQPRSDGRGVWYGIARLASRRATTVAVVVIGAFLVAGMPFLHVHLGIVDDRNFHNTVSSRIVGDQLRHEFTGQIGAPLSVVIPDAGPRPAVALSAFAARLARVPGIVRVDTSTGTFTRGGRSVRAPALAPARYARGRARWLSVVSDREPLSAEASSQVAELRAVPSSFGTVLVTGAAANDRDVTARVVGGLPLTVAFVCLAGFLALLLQFGSIPAAAVGVFATLLCLCAMFGVLTFVFQDGHLSGLLGFTPVGTTYFSLPILIFCFAFGLAMDYQVFLLSRIKEEFDRTGDHEEALAVGLGRSGSIITAAAVLIALVFISSAVFSTTTFSKSFGAGLGCTVLLDAFVVRATLMPALLKLAGRRVWWAPAWLHRGLRRLGLAEA